MENEIKITKRYVPICKHCGKGCGKKCSGARKAQKVVTDRLVEERARHITSKKVKDLLPKTDEEIEKANKDLFW